MLQGSRYAAHNTTQRISGPVPRPIVPSFVPIHLEYAAGAKTNMLTDLAICTTSNPERAFFQPSALLVPPPFLALVASAGE